MHDLLKDHALGREWFDVTPEQVRTAAETALKDEADRRVAQHEWEAMSAEKAELRTRRRLAKMGPKRGMDSDLDN
jgi:hypothetical protein